MKMLSYKTLSIIPLIVGAASLAMAADFSGGAKRAPVSAKDMPPPVTLQTLPQAQEPVSFETSAPAVADPSAGAVADMTSPEAPLLSGAVSIAGPAGPDLNFNSVTAENRSRLFTDIEVQLQKNSEAIGALRARSGELSGDASARLASANAELAAKEVALRASLNSARTANATASWEGTRSKLAADYGAYLAARNRYEMLFPVGFTTPAINVEPTSVTIETPAATEPKADAATPAKEVSPSAQPEKSPASDAKSAPSGQTTEMQ